LIEDVVRDDYCHRSGEWRVPEQEKIRAARAPRVVWIRRSGLPFWMILGMSPSSSASAARATASPPFDHEIRCVRRIEPLVGSDDARGQLCREPASDARLALNTDQNNV
jgi:hypothetical protein